MCLGRLARTGDAVDAAAMTDDLRTMLSTLAKTFLLCGALGLLLYGAMVLVAEMPQGGRMLGLLLSAPLALIVAHLVLGALRDGHFPVRGPALLRDRQPVQYWFTIAWFGGCAIALTAIAAWCGWTLFAPA